MILTYQYKLYPNAAQAKTLERWLRKCCWIYNRALEQRIKAYKRRKESVSYYDQQALLTEWRGRIDELRLVPLAFERDALRRVDRGMKAFFRRVKAKQKPGFPRFRPWRRYRSMECLGVATYLRGDRIRIPNLGLIRCRGRLLPIGKQRGLRIIHRETGWYAQIILDNGLTPEAKPAHSSVGVDVGLESFATLSSGEKIDNPRFARVAERKLRGLQRRVSRRKKGSKNRRKAITRMARHHERIAAQRRSFAHEEARKLVNRFDLIGFENLTITNMVKCHKFARSIMDAAWGFFAFCLVYKAANAGKQAIGVDPRRSSQECPWCGKIVPKVLSERRHQCECRPGVVIDRDHAAGMVIEARALAGKRGESLVEATTDTALMLGAASRAVEARMSEFGEPNG
jgi:putative transposase